MRFKFCTSVPFRAELKADVLARWPGALIEFYGMTEGGGTCILAANCARCINQFTKSGDSHVQFDFTAYRHSGG